MAFQAHQSHFLPHQHPRIGRAMRLMTRRAAVEAHGSMFEGERPALVAVAVQAARLIRSEALPHRRPNAPVRIVAIHAAHGALRKLVMIRPLELRPFIRVAPRALRIYLHRRSRHHLTGMHLVARSTRDLVLGVAALQPPHVRRLIQVAVQADFVDRRRRQLRRIANQRRVRRFGVLLSRPVAALAGMPDESLVSGRFQRMMRILVEGLDRILVADLAGVRAGEASRQRRRFCCLRLSVARQSRRPDQEADGRGG